MFDEDPTEFYDVADFGSNWSIDGAPVRGIFDNGFKDALGGASSAPQLRVAYADKPSATGITIYNRDNQRQYKVRVIEPDIVEKEVLLILERVDSPTSGFGVEFNFNQAFIQAASGVLMNDHDITYVPSTGLYHKIGITAPTPLPGSEYFDHYTCPDCRSWERQEDIELGTGIQDDWRAQVWAPYVFANPGYGGAGSLAAYKWLMVFTGVSFVSSQSADDEQKIGLAGCVDDDLADWTVLNGDEPIYWSGMATATYPAGAPWSDYTQAWNHHTRDPHVFYYAGNYYLMAYARATNTAYTVVGLAKFAGGASPDFTSLEHEANPILTSTVAGGWQFESTFLADVNGLWHLFGKASSGTRHQSGSTIFGPPWGATTTSGSVLMNQGGYPAESGGSYGEASELVQFGGEGMLYGLSGHMLETPQGFYFIAFVELDFTDCDTVGEHPSVRPMAGIPGMVGLRAGAMDTDLRWSIQDSEGSSGAFYRQPVWGDQAASAGYGASGMSGNSYIATHFRNYVPGANLDGAEWSDYSKIGWIKSSAWTLTRDRIRFKIGGGNKPFREFVALVSAADDRILCIETGNDSHVMADRVWNVESLLGLSVYMVVVDGSTDDMGCIALDAVTEYLSSEYSDPATASTPYAPGDGPLLENVLDKVGL